MMDTSNAFLALTWPQLAGLILVYGMWDILRRTDGFSFTLSAKGARD